MDKETRRLFSEIDDILGREERRERYSANPQNYDFYWHMAQRCMPYLEEERGLDEERLIIFYLIGESIEKCVINSGSDREVLLPEGYEFRKANYYVLAHNHPHVKGSSGPSPDDDRLTLSIKSKVEMNGGEFCDHIIVWDGGEYSYREHRWVIAGGER